MIRKCWRGQGILVRLEIESAFISDGGRLTIIGFSDGQDGFGWRIVGQSCRKLIKIEGVSGRGFFQSHIYYC